MSNFMQGEMISDHFAVLFDLHIPSKSRCKRIIKFRKVKEIDASSFATDLQKAFIPPTSPGKLSKLVNGYNQVVASVVDQHAPLKTKRVVYEHYQPWYCSEIGDAVSNHRKLERIWRADVKNKDKWVAFNKQRKVNLAIIKKREKEYCHLLFTEKVSNPKEVFNITNTLLARNNISPLPECSFLMELANDFNKFFVDKITSIRDNIINTHFNGIHPTPVEPVNESNISEMNSFQGIIERDVKKRIRELPSKSCKLDLMLTTLLKSMVDVVTPVITHIINVSLLLGEFYQNLKVAHPKPLIKKIGLHLVFKSFCPVSNLSYISKLVKRFAADQLVDHVIQNGLSEKFQSAYRASHSTETALTCVRNDILLNMDNQKSTFLVLFSLSAAFDTLGHATLLNHLQKRGSKSQM